MSAKLIYLLLPVAFSNCFSSSRAESSQGALNKPLFEAAKRGLTIELSDLVKKGADFTTRNKDGQTAFDITVLKGYVDCVKALVKQSYRLLPSEQVVSDSRKRIFTILLQFVWLRNRYAELALLKDATLQFEILSRNKLLQEDLAIILLDELKKGREIKNVALIRSKEAAVCYLNTKVSELLKPSICPYRQPVRKDLLDRLKCLGSFGALIREGLNERIEELKDSSSR